MGRAKTQVDDLTALREATTEAHHAIQSLKTASREAEAAREALIETRAEIIEMAKAIWDARLEALAQEAVDNFNKSSQEGIERLLGEVGVRFTDVLMVILGEKRPDEIKPETLVEQMVADRVAQHGPWHVHL